MNEARAVDEGHDSPPKVASAGVDVVVRIETASRGALRTLRKLARQCSDSVRLVVIDDANSDEEFRSKLMRFTRECPHVLSLRSETPRGFLQSMRLARAQARGRDLILLDPELRIFANSIGALHAAAHSEPRVGMVCPISNRARRAVVPEWQLPLSRPAQISGKRWAKLVSRVAPRARAELSSPSLECVLLTAALLEELGDFDQQSESAEQALLEYASRARARGFSLRLADEVYVEVKSALPSRVSMAPTGGAEGLPFSEVLAWHVKRGTATNRAAPLILLDETPFAAGTGVQIETVIRAAALPRSVLAYPVGAALEIVEVLNGDWHSPIFYRRELDDSPDQLSLTRENALREILTLFQIGWIDLHGLAFWQSVLNAVLPNVTLPYCVTLLEANPAAIGLEPADAPSTEAGAPTSGAALLAGATRVLCANQNLQERLVSQLGIKRKRTRVLDVVSALDAGTPGVVPEPSLPSSRAAAYDVVAQIYSACKRRSPAEVRKWRTREELARLDALRVTKTALVRLSSRPVQEPRKPSVIDGLRSHVPNVFRSLSAKLRSSASSRRTRR